MPTVADIIDHLERFAPPWTAAEWDNVGLLLGEANSPADRIMTCLTVTSEVVAEAVTGGVQLIVSHHPILFRGAKKLSSQTPEGRLLWPLMRAGVAVYSPHTAFDNCTGGINDGLCRSLGLTNVSPLRPTDGAKRFKLVVFVPDEDLQKVSDAMFAAGAGRIGQYEQCSFRLNGTGTFYGTDTTYPAVGQKGRREEVAEWRLEVVVPETKLTAVVAAMRATHSYEEPAFDVYSLTTGKSTTHGEGRIGDIVATTLGELANLVKVNLRANSVQIVGDSQRQVKRIAVACGAAGEFLSDAIRANADVFLTGEVRFHDALKAEAAGVGLILPGHYATERPAVEDLAGKLAETFPSATVWASRQESDPLKIIG